jgi:hypothetical protein
MKLWSSVFADMTILPFWVGMCVGRDSLGELSAKNIILDLDKVHFFGRFSDGSNMLIISITIMGICSKVVWLLM